MLSIYICTYVPTYVSTYTFMKLSNFCAFIAFNVYNWLFLTNTIYFFYFFAFSTNILLCRSVHLYIIFHYECNFCRQFYSFFFWLLSTCSHTCKYMSIHMYIVYVLYFFCYFFIFGACIFRLCFTFAFFNFFYNFSFHFHFTGGRRNGVVCVMLWIFAVMRTCLA